MEVAILKNDGTAVALDSSFTDMAFDIEGFLLEFNFTNNVSRRFKYYQKNDFKLADREKYTSLSGYYVEGKYLSYMQGLESDSPNIEDLKSKFLFQFDKYKAKAGNSIKVSVVDLGEPYSRYYNNVEYSFKIQNYESSSIPKKYLKPVYEGVLKIGDEIDIPANASKNVIERTPLKLATRYFYNNNYTRYLGVWTSDVTKHNIKKIATLIAFRIAEIEREIFPKLANSSTWGMLDAIADSPNGSIDSLNDFQKMLFILKKTWGYYHDPSADESYVHKHDFEPIFSFVPGYEDYLNYYNNLTDFFFALYKIQDKLLNISEDLRLRYLLQTLPVSALTIVPYSIIKNQLSGYSKIKNLPESSQRHVIHLIISITKRPEYSDDFLDFLLIKENGVVTNFEALYSLLTDGRLERYTVVNWFVDEQTNRKYFAYAIFDLWKTSYYNWSYVPSNNGSGNQGDFVNLNSYFIKNKKEYIADNVFEFSPLNINQIAGKFNDVKNRISAKLLSSKIEISVQSTTTKYFFNRRTGKFEYDKPISDSKVNKFHLFHPITLVGYQPNLELRIPQRTLIPAFLFFFAEEYDELADFDAAISLGIDIAIDIALFFASGGVGILKDLKYLKYLTRLGEALRGELAATDAVTIWRAAETGAEVITLAASTIVNYNQYLSTTENNIEKQKHHQKIQWLMMGLLFFAAGGVAYSRVRAVSEAGEILDIMATFPGTTHGVPDSLVELLERLAGKRAVLISEMGSKLQEFKLQGVEIDNIIAKFESLTDKQKYKFWEHFNKINDKQIWEYLDNYSRSIDNWLYLSEIGIKEANVLAFITDQDLVDAIIRYSLDPEFKRILNTFDYDTKVKFLRDFGKQPDSWFNVLKQDATAINRWEKLDKVGKLFAKNKPNKWLYTFDKTYYNIPYVKRLSNAEITEHFGEEVITFVDYVELKALETIADPSAKLDKLELASAMYDKVTGKVSKVFNNFHGYDVTNRGGDFDLFMNGSKNDPKVRCFPNLREKIEDVIAFKSKQNYNMADKSFYGNASKRPGIHAEVRALDDLAKEKFPDYLINPPTNEVFDTWLKNDVLGYNRNIRYGFDQEKVIQHTCADCYYILDLVTFVKR